jgi:activator of HSP90 ATPase
MTDPSVLLTSARLAPTRRQVIIGTTLAAAGLAVSSIDAGATEDGISHSAEAIRQESLFQASRKRVYEALTDAQQFHKVSLLSAAVQSGATENKPTEMNPEPGGAFSLFGGYITGRFLDLVPSERIVQAWRSESWHAGDFSIVKFELIDQGSGTKVVLSHRGFPDGESAHLAAGWKANYWEPLGKYLSGMKQEIRK